MTVHYPTKKRIVAHTKFLNKSVCISGERTSKNPSDWKVRIGEHSLLRDEGREVMKEVRQILIHPNYKPSNSSHPGNNDIGMATSSFYLA